MPKQKKQPNGPIYFYMKDRQKQLEREGHRFPGGIKDVFSACGPEWKALPVEAKAKYEAMAKEEKEKQKYNLHNKFTNTGESYFQVQERIQRDKEEKERLDNFIEKLASSDTDGRRPQDRVYILIKCTNSVVETSNGGGQIYWPSEIAVVAFNLAKGPKGVYSTLVDTVNAPLGFASHAKDSSEEYGVPYPGHEQFEEKCRNYELIFSTIKYFIKKNLGDYDDDESYALFCLPGEIEPARGSLNWLIQNMPGDNEDAQKFWSNLEFCDLSKLMVKMAVYGKKINPSYKSTLADHKLDLAACDMLKTGSYDYKSEITCEHHCQGEAAQKMNYCCKNIVMRRMFLILKEFVKQYGIQRNEAHDIDALPKKEPAQASLRTGATSSSNGGSPRRHDEWERMTQSGSHYGGNGKHVAKKCKSDGASSSSSQYYPSPNTSMFEDNGENHDEASFFWKGGSNNSK